MFNLAITDHNATVRAFNNRIKELEKTIEGLNKQLDAVKWMEWVYEDGLCRQDILNELSDWRFTMHQIFEIYPAVTGGQMSGKSNYYARDVIAHFEDHMQEMINEAVREAVDEALEAVDTNP